MCVRSSHCKEEHTKVGDITTSMHARECEGVAPSPDRGRQPLTVSS